MNLLLGISNGDLAITAVLTGIGLVFAALLIARLISPRSFSVKNPSLTNVVSPLVANPCFSLR